MNLSLKKDKAAFILILILAFLIGRNNIYNNSIEKINSLQSRQEEEKNKNELLETISILEKKIQIYKRNSLASVEIAPLLDKVSALAKRSGMVIENFNPQPTIYKEGYAEVPVDISLSGDYHRLGRFLSLLESSQEFIWVKRLRVEKATVIDPQKRISPKISLAISGLYFKK
jgi:Tfp pilus assembly protein PilO